MLILNTWWRKIPKNAVKTAESKSASSQTIIGLLPPSSRVTLFKFESAEAFKIAFPVNPDPVNEIFNLFIYLFIFIYFWKKKFTFLIFICLATAFPAFWPYPGTTLTTPGGNPALTINSAKARILRGVFSEGLITIVFPLNYLFIYLFIYLEIYLQKKKKEKEKPSKSRTKFPTSEH